MLHKKYKNYVTLFFLLFSVSAHANAESQFNNCIKSSVKAQENPPAIIFSVCLSEFTDIRTGSGAKKLPDQAVHNIEGRASVSNNSLRGSIYNGNKDWHVSVLVIRVDDASTNTSRDYQVNVTDDFHSPSVGPYRSGPFGVELFSEGNDISWGILDAYGYE